MASGGPAGVSLGNDLPGLNVTTPYVSGTPFLDHDDQGPRLNIVIWLLQSLATLFLALRIYCKWSQRRGLWWDDYILVATWVRPHSTTPPPPSSKD